LRFQLLFLLLPAAAWSADLLLVVSAANSSSGTVAPGSLALATGAGFSSPQVTVTDSGNTSRDAPVTNASSTEVRFVVPTDIALGAGTVTVRNDDGSAATGSVIIVAVAPGIFSTSRNDSGILELTATGLRGRTSPITCTIADVVATVLSVDFSDDQPGIDRVNIELPTMLAGDDLPISLVVDGQPANIVTVTVPTPPYVDTRSRAAAIVSQMTLAEKIQQLHGIQDPTHYRTVPGLDRLGIPALNITNGPAGATNGGPGHQGPATALPAPIALAATWDIAMAKLYGSIIGLEAGKLANGFLEGPDINIARVPQNGRNFEAYGEDPYLTGRIAAAHIAGIQSHGIIAEAKHYAGNNQENNRTTISDTIDERTLREIYLPAFETSVREGGAGAVMCAYNKVNSVYSCENDLLMNQILKKEWGFNGFITSDFGAVHSTGPSALAGLDLEMPTGVYFTNPLQAAVQAGDVPMSVIDDKLVRRFSTMMQFGIFDAPTTSQPVPTDQDGVLARRIAEAGMVLLKNDGAVLPLDATQLHSIAVIGPYAKAAKTGGGGSSQVVPAYTVDPVKGIQNRAGPDVIVTFADGSSLSAAAALAKSADVAIVMVGDDQQEGVDHSIALAGTQDQLVQAVAAANPQTVVVLKTGGPVLMPWVDAVPAILEAWYPGEEDGNAVAAVLFGDVNPSGKLPQTFPKSVADLPANTPEQYPGVNGVANYSEGIFVGYRHFDANGIEPLFPFGHGLSYTSFEYGELTVHQTSLGPFLLFMVTNTGSVAGREVTQIYLGIPSDAVPQPPSQLKAFGKVFLQPGENAIMGFALNARALSYWDVNSHAWQMPKGTFQVMVGSSSRDIRQQTQITFP
jgi:beta-glucosidase